MPFDADAISRTERKPNDLIPAGTRVRVRVEAAVEAKSKAGTEMVELRLRVEGGPHAGASLFERHVLTGVGAVFLADLSRAIGRPRWQHAPELERGTCEAIVRVEAQDGYAARNRVGRYVVAAIRDSDVPF